jgi:hypothetical protein
MNMLYEGLKRSNATIVIMPSTAVESMQLGGAPMVTIASAIAHAQTADAWTVGRLPGAPIARAPRRRRGGGFERDCRNCAAVRANAARSPSADVGLGL